MATKTSTNIMYSKGPDKDVAFNTSRVDWHMKGDYSRTDETKLSFLLISINTKTLNLTLRECLWNINPVHPPKNIKWGSSKTISLK